MRVREAASLLMMEGPEAFITPEQNDENTENVIENWYLGPEEPSSDPDANGDFWAAYADIMNVGAQGDIYDLTISYDHPASWGASV